MDLGEVLDASYHRSLSTAIDTVDDRRPTLSTAVDLIVSIARDSSGTHLAQGFPSS
jgi:hypothetical protein